MGNILNGAEHGETLRGVMNRIYNGIFSGELPLEAFFAPEYRQISDGKTLTYQQFASHVQHVRASVAQIAIEVDDAARDGDLIADRHTVRITHADGRKAVLEVYAFARLKDDRVVELNEVSRVVLGDRSVQSLASDLPERPL